MRGMILGLIFLASLAGAQQDSRYEIRLLGRSWTPAAGVPREMDRAFSAQAAQARTAGQERIHALVQLHEVPDDSQRNELARQGLELGAYVPGNAWIATIPADRAAAVARRSEVRWMEPWTAGHKLHPRLAAGKPPEQIAVMVLLHEDVDLGRGAALAERAGGSAGRPVDGLHGIPMWIPGAGLATLAAEEEVLWIEEAAPPLSAANNGIRSQMRVDAVNGSPYDLDGKGVRLFVFDDGAVRGTHDSFNSRTGSRVTNIDNSLSLLSGHATHVAGTAAGDGSGSPSLRGRGVASAADILSAALEPTIYPHFFTDAADVEDDYATARNSYEADLANNSLSTNVASNGYSCSWEGDYATTSSLLDKIVRGNGTAINGAVISIWANGNERGGDHGRCGANYQTTPEPACAKNPIAVGAINSDGASMTRFSSWGPCSDGRLKPTIVAPGCESSRVSGERFIYSASCLTENGCTSDTLYGAEGFCGTSMAAPAVSGAISLLLQDWRQHLTGFSSVDTARLLPALVKAALIQTARDLGPEGPDYRYGYGAVDAQALIDFERAAGTGGLGGPGLKVWGTSTLTHGSNDSFTITVPSGIAELKASLAWDDLAAAPFAALALVNDLDLEVVAPGGTVYHPFFVDPAHPHLPATATGANHLDNQEQVLVKNPQAGVWTVRVRGANVPQGAQLYGLTYGATPLTFSTSCTETFSGFESGNDSWTLSNGAVRVAAPAPGHGSYSVKLGGTNNNDASEMKRQLALPVGQKSTLSFDFYMTTTEGAAGWGYDNFNAEVRDTNGSVLSVLSFHNDGDVPAVWLTERNIDLSPWAGQTVELVFRAVTDGLLPTTFWVDDVRVTNCPAASFLISPSPIESTGTQDGHVFEASESSSVGGTAVWNNSSLLGADTFQVGDNGSDAEIKGFVSFNTSSLPDNAILVSARLVLNRSALLGTNPFATHGVCRVEIKTGAFANNPALEPADFQSVATGQPVAILSNPTANGSLAYATLSAQGLAAINKTGTTQLRISFEQGDDDDLAGDALFFVAGEDTTASLRPRLEVTYLMP